MAAPEAIAKRKLAHSELELISSPRASKRPLTALSYQQGTSEPRVTGDFSRFDAPSYSLRDEPVAVPLGDTSFCENQPLGFSNQEQGYGLYNGGLSIGIDYLDPGPAFPDMSSQQNSDTAVTSVAAASHSASDYGFAWENDGVAPSAFQIGDLPWNSNSSIDETLEMDTASTDYFSGNSQTPDLALASTIPSQASRDTCFGVIVAPLTISTDIPKTQKTVDVDLRRYGALFKLYSKEKNTYTGTLALPGLDKLVEWPTVQLKARLMPSVMGTNPKNPKQKEKPIRSRETLDLKNVDCRILVYGSRAEGHDLGLTLSDAALYLQHPFVEEVDNDLTYWNPHILIRPKGTMPKLEDLSLNPSGSPNVEQSLDEVDKCRILRIFDSADGPAMVSALSEPSPRLIPKPMRHQLQAIEMMEERESKNVGESKFPTLWVPEDSPLEGLHYRHIITGTINKTPVHTCGGILADDMGLGKSFSTLALICSSLDALERDAVELKGGKIKATLIVTPMSTTVSWRQQINRHIHEDSFSYSLYHGSDRRKVARGFKSHDVVLTTYETLRSDIKSKGPLASTKWFRVILDEAHHIRNRSSQVFQAACKLRARYRWCLTGTPIQNSVDDYGALLAFIRVPSLATKAQFDKHISIPIRDRAPNAFNRLRDLVSATCLRRTKTTAGLDFQLPPKLERVEYVALDSEDQQLYDLFQRRTQDVASQRIINRSGSTEPQGRNILSLITILRRICDHGRHMLPARAFELLPPTVDEGGNNASPLPGIVSLETSCSQCGEDLDDMPSTQADASHSLQETWRLCISCQAAQNENDQVIEAMELDDDTPKPITNAVLPSGVVFPSAKVKALLENIHRSPSKSVVFTSWTAMMDLVEHAFRVNVINFTRLDGQMSPKARGKAIDEFSTDPQCIAILCNIGSAAEGIDLTAGSQVHILEPHWNPMSEAQAVDRVHRIGQTKDVTVIRYLVKDSVEMYVKWVQDEKLRLISRSLSCMEKAEEYEQRKAQMLRSFLKADRDDSEV